MEFNDADPPRRREVRHRGQRHRAPTPSCRPARPRAAPAPARGRGRDASIPYGQERRPVRAAARSPAAGRSERAQPFAGCARRPRALAAAQGSKFDRSKYETVRSLDRLNAWIAARQRHRHRRARDRDHQPRSDAGGALRLLARGRRQRGLLRAARAIATATAERHRPVRAGAQLRAGSDSGDGGARRAASRCWRTGRAQDRAGPEIRLADVRAAAASTLRRTTTPC